jgi:hypothetical protein
MTLCISTLDAKRCCDFTTVYTTIFLAIAGSASDTFVAYNLMVLGWGDPLVLLEPTNMSKASSSLNNLVVVFDVLRKCASNERPRLNISLD